MQNACFLFWCVQMEEREKMRAAPNQARCRQVLSVSICLIVGEAKMKKFFSAMCQLQIRISSSKCGFDAV